MVVYTSWREWYYMASFSILIGAGRILVQESLVMSLKKKKMHFWFFFPRRSFSLWPWLSWALTQRATCFCFPNAATTTQKKCTSDITGQDAWAWWEMHAFTPALRRQGQAISWGEGQSALQSEFRTTMATQETLTWKDQNHHKTVLTIW